MGSISGFGIGFAVLTGALATSLTVRAAEPVGNELRIDLGELRNTRGKVHACLTKFRAYFPNCKADANSRCGSQLAPARRASCVSPPFRSGATRSRSSTMRMATESSTLSRGSRARDTAFPETLRCVSDRPGSTRRGSIWCQAGTDKRSGCVTSFSPYGRRHLPILR